MYICVYMFHRSDSGRRDGGHPHQHRGGATGTSAEASESHDRRGCKESAGRRHPSRDAHCYRSQQEHCSEDCSYKSECSL